VRHAALGQVQVGERTGVDHPEPVVRVGDVEVGGQPGEGDCPSQQDAACGRHVDGGTGEPRRKHHVDVGDPGASQHPDGIADQVLAVGVERHDPVELGMCSNPGESGFQGRPGTQVDRVASNRRASGSGQRSGVVGAAVIDDEHVLELPEELGDDAADRRCLVVRRDDDADVFVRHGRPPASSGVELILNHHREGRKGHSGKTAEMRQTCPVGWADMARSD
jgi:hypothetical protein